MVLYDCFLFVNCVLLGLVVFSLEVILGNKNMQIDELLVQYAATSSIGDIVLNCHVTF